MRVLCTHAMLGQDLDSVLNQAIVAEDEFSIITRSGAATSLRSNAQGGNSTNPNKGPRFLNQVPTLHPKPSNLKPLKLSIFLDLNSHSFVLRGHWRFLRGHWRTGL